MKKYPWRPCTKCGSVSNPHATETLERRRAGFHSWCKSCLREASRTGEHCLRIGHPALVHRHRCEECRAIFDCKPCHHYREFVPTETVPRICPKCKQEKAA